MNSAGTLLGQLSMNGGAAAGDHSPMETAVYSTISNEGARALCGQQQQVAKKANIDERYVVIK